MFNNWYRKERPIQGMMGMGGGTTGYLTGGGGGPNPPLYNWTAGTTYTFNADNIDTGALGSPDSTIYGNPNYSGSGFRNGGRHLFSTVEHDHTVNWRGVIKLVIPEDGVYELSARGAAGGDCPNSSSGGTAYGGRGSYCTTRGPLLGGDIILIVVGKKGIEQSYCGGGGGGSFVWYVGNYWDNGGSGMNYSYNSRTLESIICAGGGGSGAHGSPFNATDGRGINGSTNIFGTRSSVSTPGPGISPPSYDYNSFRRQAAGYAGQIDWGGPGARNFEGGGGAGFMSRTASPDDANQNNPVSWMAIPESYAFPGPNPNFGAFNHSQNAVFTMAGNQPLNSSGGGYPGNSGGPTSQWADGPSRQNRGVSSVPSDYHRAFHGGAGSSPIGHSNSPVNQNDGGFGGGGGGSRGCGGSGAGGGFSGGMNSGCYATSGAGGIYGRDSAEGFTDWSRQNTGVYPGYQSGEVTIQRIS